jgi:hypothetical protein
MIIQHHDGPRRVALLIEPAGRDRFSRTEDYYHLTLAVVLLDEKDRVRNPSSTAYKLDELGLADLRIYSQGDNNAAPPRKLYAWKVEYNSPHSVDAHRAEAMHKMLKRIQKKLDAISDVRGHAADYAEFVGRVAETFGKDTLIVRYSELQSVESTYDNNDFRIMSIAEGVNQIRYIVRQWENKEAA